MVDPTSFLHPFWSSSPPFCPRFVAKLLDSDEDAAENWVVELIRSGQLKARISSSEKIVIVEPPQSRVYVQSTLLLCSTHDSHSRYSLRHQIVAEKTKATLSRAQFVWNRLGFADRPSHKYK